MTQRIRERIAKRLEKVLNKFKTIHHSKFNYSSYVEKGDTKTKCGTICCVAGWYPVLLSEKESPLKWGITKHYTGLLELELLTKNNGRLTRIAEALCSYHEIDHRLEAALFIGADYYNQQSLTFVSLTKEIGLEQVKKSSVQKRWELIIKQIRRGELDSYLKPKNKQNNKF